MKKGFSLAFIFSCFIFLMLGCRSMNDIGYVKTSTLTEPPELKVICEDTSIKALLRTYSWTYEISDSIGKSRSQSVCADGAHPLDSKKYMTSPLTFTATDDLSESTPSVTLQFGIASDSITVNCWHTDYFGNSSATSENIPVTGSSFKLKDGDYVYEVVATWDSDKHSFGGTAYYSFYTVKHIAEGEAEPIEPSTPEADGKAITNIVDTSKDYLDIAFSMALEPIYEDNTAVYSFSCIKSHYVFVYYADGTKETVKTALSAGRATIADLDRFGIEYYKEAK